MSETVSGGTRSGDQRGREEGGSIFVVSAPSGTGKTTLVRRVLKELPGLRFSISYTTRLPRGNERDGEDYHFVAPSVFQKMVGEGKFLEWAEVSGNYYGTTWVDLERLKSEGGDLILDIDTQGARKVMEKIDHPVLVFILPPSPEVLRDRLIKRGLDSPEAIRVRLANAKKEIEESSRYHYVIVNDEVEEAAEQLKAIVIAERCRRGKQAILEKKKREWEETHGKNYSGRLSEKGGKPL